MEDYILDMSFGPVYWDCGNGHRVEVNVYRPAVKEDGSVTSGYFGSNFHRCSDCDEPSSGKQRSQIVEELTDIVKCAMAIDVSNKIIAAYQDLEKLYDWADSCASDFKEEHMKYRSIANSYFLNNDKYLVAAEALSEVLMHAISAIGAALYDLTVSIPIGKIELFLRAKEYIEDVMEAKHIYEKQIQHDNSDTTGGYVICSECGWYNDGFHSRGCSKRSNTEIAINSYRS